MEQWDVLGPAEKLIAKQIHETLVTSAKTASKLASDLEQLADLDIEEAMADPKKKDTLIAVAEQLQKMPRNLADTALVMTIMKIIFIKTE